MGKGDNQKLSAGCIKFELPTRHPDGISVGICGLEFRGEVQLVFLIFFITFIISNMKNKNEMVITTKSSRS